MRFYDFIKNASKDLDKAIENKAQERDIWEGRIPRNMDKVMMLPYYIQYKLIISNRWLVYATWGLAIATILLLLFK